MSEKSNVDLACELTEKVFEQNSDGYICHIENKTANEIVEIIEAYQIDENGDDISRAFALVDSLKDWLRFQAANEK